MEKQKKTYRLTWKQTTTKISKPIEAKNEREAEEQWLEQGCPGYQDIAGAGIKVEEIEDETFEET